MGAHESGAAIIDVLIAAWNCGHTIERAVSSALTEPEVRRVIVVDDGSSDDTAGRVRRLERRGERVIPVELSTNLGPSAARNRALEISTAQWVAILDGDDFLLPGRMGKLLAHAAEQDAVADDILRAQDGEPLTEARPVMFDGPFEPWSLDFAGFVLANAGRRSRRRAEFGYFKPLIRREFIDRHGIRYDARLRLGEDYAFYARLLAHGARFLVAPACGYVATVRESSLSARHRRQDLERLRDLDLELMMIPTLTSADRRALLKHYRSVDARVQWLRVIEAFKARSPGDFLRPFARSPEVALFLARKLFEEACTRSEKWLTHQGR